MYDHCDMPEFYSETRHVARRRESKCCECGLPIKLGTAYIACRGKWDGDMFENKQHEECYDLCRHINMDILLDCVIPFGGLREWLCDSDVLSLDTGTSQDAAILDQLKRIEDLYAPRPSRWLLDLLDRYDDDDDRKYPNRQHWLAHKEWPFALDPVDITRSLRDRLARCPVMGSERAQRA